MQGVSRMSDTLQWVEQIRSDLKPLEGKILGHSYLKALAEGRLQRDQLKVFALQQHHIISSDLRSIALIVSRQGMLPSRRFMLNVLQGEAVALDALHAFADALGLDASDLEVLEPLPAAHTYCAFVAGLRFRRWRRDSGRPENGLGAGCLWHDCNYRSHGTKYDWGIRDRGDRAEVRGPADRSVRQRHRLRRGEDRNARQRRDHRRGCSRNLRAQTKLAGRGPGDDREEWRTPAKTRRYRSPQGQTAAVGDRGHAQPA